MLAIWTGSPRSANSAKGKRLLSPVENKIKMKIADKNQIFINATITIRPEVQKAWTNEISMQCVKFLMKMSMAACVTV